ncbi:DNA repair protein RecO [Priestia koreensis]|uniref:DNA repair protein RecO n=1 Tax=Priestia koreensis TaxID=284581 RepID=UPI00203C4D83|nr:DNA repair protein RecO [Priestia koreensis]MCM3002523.1 DNA repair protein RecO [Priestia koreensis]
MLKKCEGIVIRTNDYGESNKIITIYTRELGKIGLMARGARKPSSRLSSLTHLFTYGQFLFQGGGSGMGTLQQGESISSMRSIREDIFLTAYASYIVELTDKATENNQINPFLFQLLYQTLSYLEEGFDMEVLAIIFEMKILNVLGLYPQLDRCAFCGATDGRFGFSIREGGLICHRCAEKDPYHLQISPATVKLLRLFYYLDLTRLGTISLKPETKKQLRLVVDMYYDEYSGIVLKSKRFLKQMEQLKDTFKDS